MDMIGPPQVFKGVGSLTTSVATDRAIRPAIAGSIVEVEGQPRFPFPLVMGIADPCPGRPGIDVEILLIAIACVGTTVVTHLTELPDRLVVSIKVAFAHLNPLSNHVTGLIRVLRCTETLKPVVPRVVPVGVEDIVGLDHESRHRFDLVIEEKHVGIDVRAAVIQIIGVSAAIDRKVIMESAERFSLPEIRLRSAEPTSVTIPGLGTVL